MVQAIELQPDARTAQIVYRPDATIEQLFGRFPPLETPSARTLGFSDDGDVAALIQRAVQDGE